MSSEIAIDIKNISKSYKIFKKPVDRLLQMLPWNKNKNLSEEFWAVSNINMKIYKGEVVGLIGKNGAGKSTLLQLVCNTLEPTEGEIKVLGKIAALLELGSGFNPEFSGRDNVYMAAAIAGLSKEETDEKYDDIVKFSEIGEFINSPVKTYSSGMMVRLAFSVATSVEPDILIIDEALSVGDGAFSRKSFDRIMQLKERGCTILFCSHALYQVEVLCKKVMWIDKGEIKAFGEPSGVVNMYQKYLDNLDGNTEISNLKAVTSNHARIKNITVSSDDGQEGDLKLESETSTLSVDVSFVSDIDLPTPSVAIVITDDVGKNITSCSTFYDGIKLELDANGEGNINLTFTKIGLNRGRYYLHVLLMCENAIHIYESIQCASLNVTQKGSEVGIVALPREWKSI
jgi:lipopolysaccharide transport system ATP-binding protein